jgi:hypothetical protein
MVEHEYRDGSLEYFVKDRVPADGIKDHVLGHAWDGGFAAFSRGEKDLDDLDLDELVSGAGDRVATGNGIEGYLMELDLWRRREDKIEELVLEREGDGFLLQKWTLTTNPDGKANCHYRTASTRLRGRYGGRRQDSIEVVAPEHRLHFYITTG